MKRAGYVGCLIVLIYCLACNEIKEKLLPSFNVTIPIVKLTVPAVPVVFDKEMAAGALKTHINMDSTIRANTAGAFGANAVHVVKVKRLIIKVLNADAENNLSNFSSARMTIYSDTASTDIANIRFPETFSDSLTVTAVNSPDISNYLRGSNLAYNLYWRNRRVTRKRLKMDVQVTLSIQ